AKRILLAPLAMILTCCTNKDAKSQQKITINIESDYTTLDPRKIRILNDYNILVAFNEGLFRMTNNGPLPGIAKDYSFSPDKKKCTITLKKTVWSNGDPLTAHDFLYTWKSLLKKDFPSPNAHFFFPILHAKEIKKGTLPPSSLGVNVINDYCLEIVLEKPLPCLLELLALPIAFPVHRHIDKIHPKWAEEPSSYVCNGPFCIHKKMNNNSILAKKNPTYHDQKNVRLDMIEMMMLDEYTAYNLFKDHQLDYIGSPFSNIPVEAMEECEKKGSIISSPFLGTYWIRINTKNKTLQNIHLRKALALSVNRKSISLHLFNGMLETATSIVPTSERLNKNDLFKDGDLEAAKKHIKLAREELSDIPPLHFSFISSQINNNVALILQDVWKQTLGVEIIIHPKENKIFFDDLGKGDFQLAYSGRIADFQGPLDFLETFKDREGATNNTFWENDQYKSLLEQSYETLDIKKRSEMLSQAEEILIKEMPVIPMHHLNMIYLKNQNLKGLTISKTGVIDFKYAYLSS
ncbi:peptide ABC transporter substrate-binding protein, partial [bacterium]|nr:peptide ABC transporter substrate-binding protein [bacterium]